MMIRKTKRMHTKLINKTLLFSSAAVLATTSLTAQATETDPLYELGKTKFEQVCIACHKYERGPAMIAPPVFAMQMHYRERYEDDEAGFRKAIVDWAKAPDEKKTLMPGAIMKFKIMPPMPLPDADLDAIAAYLYRADFVGECDPSQMQKNRTSKLQPTATEN